MDHFHRYRQNGQPGSAAAHLERALHTPEYRSEALIWKGIDALQHNKPQSAFSHLSNAARALPQRGDVLALLGRSIQLQGRPELALRFLAAAWRDAPLDVTLRMALWQARGQQRDALPLTPAILKHLPEVTDGRELKLLMGLLAGQKQAPTLIGVVHHDIATGELHGWAVDLRAPGHAPRLLLRSATGSQAVLADAPSRLLAEAGLPGSHGAFRISAPGLGEVTLGSADGVALAGSPLSILAAFQPPQPLAVDFAARPVDVLVPVYEGLHETLECLDSVLRNAHLNRTEHRLVVLDDATPNSALQNALVALAEAGSIHYVRQPTNLGFIRNTNRGMALSPDRDVVWLNADTRVHGNWLDRLREVAYQADDIASVTPFTNNGELMSFPASRISHDMPDAEQHAQLDQLAAGLPQDAVEIETGCGFCLYIKRSALNAVGYLDEVHLLRGYGEETDWCLRARSLGWRHMGAPRVFVAHQGGISFGNEKALRVAHNNAILRRRYPDAPGRYQRFCLRDPLHDVRQGLQRARLVQLADWIGEAPQHAELIIHADRDVTAPLTLCYQHAARGCIATLTAHLAPLPVRLEYRMPEQHQQLLDDLQGLPLAELVYLQPSRCPTQALALPAQLARPYRIRCHDDLATSQDAAWLDFARQARQLELPWAAQVESYARLLPEVPLLAPGKRTRLPKAGKNPQVLLIADSLQQPEIARQWQALARQITLEKLPLRLLCLHDGAWLPNLLNTGAVEAVQAMPGLSLGECLQLAGVQAALSLDATPDSSWAAPALAAAHSLPLYAPAHAVSEEAGAHAISLLPIPRSRAPRR